MHIVLIEVEWQELVTHRGASASWAASLVPLKLGLGSLSFFHLGKTL